MKAIVAATAMAALGTTQVSAEEIEIRRYGQTPSVTGKAENFSGQTVINTLLSPNDSARENLGNLNWQQVLMAFTAFSIALILARTCAGHLPDRFGGARVG